MNELNASPLEYLSELYENVVTRDAEGNVTGVFVKFPKMKSSDLDASLPEHVHPAFVVNGQEKPFIYLGKYLCSRHGEKLLGLPYRESYLSSETETPENLRKGMRRAGTGITGMTIADYGFLRLLAKKRGWNPRGNTHHGQDAYAGTVWKEELIFAAGDKACFAGMRYECLEAHTASAENRPDIARGIWKTSGEAGAVCTLTEMQSLYDVGIPSVTGTGPRKWFMENDPGQVCDLIGNVHESPLGVRLNHGEIQILPDNDAADPSAKISTYSDAWKAILPGESAEDWTLVEPGTTGTVHYTWSTDHIELDNANTDTGLRLCAFDDMTCNARIAYIPCILRELGLYPLNGETEGGTMALDLNGIRVPLALYGDSTSGAYAGFGRIATARTGVHRGCRARLSV